MLKLYIKSHHDYRDVEPTLTVLEEEEFNEVGSDNEADYDEFILKIPGGKKHDRILYFVNDQGKIIYKKKYKIDDETNIDDVVYKIYTIFNNRGKFISTERNCAYKELGEFEEIPEHIKNMKTIKKLKDLSNNNDISLHRYYVIVIYDTGEYEYEYII